MKFEGFEDWVEIFLGGKQTDSEGREHDGDQLIEKALASFDPRTHEPPLVIGHPQENAPAYGWVEGLRKAVRDGTAVLLAKFRQVVPEFAAMVREGRFKKRSASFYPDGRLRHVGFLGAAPPAVKGLADLKFESEEEHMVFEFAASEEDKEAQRARAKKYGIAVKEGGHVTKPSEWESVPDEQFLDPVNYRYPCPDADQTRAAASYWGRPRNKEQYTPEERAKIDARLDTFRKKFGIMQKEKEAKMSGFKEKFKNFLSFMGVDISKVPDEALPDDAPELKGTSFTEADLEAARKKAAEEAAAAERKKAEAEFAEKERERAKSQRGTEISAWCDTLVKDGKVLPAWVKMGLKEFALKLDGEEELEFSEGKKETLQAWFKKFVDELPKVVVFKEIATRNKDAAAGSAGDKLEALTRKKMGERKDLSYSAAFLEAQAENPELAKEYVQEMRA